MVNDWFPLGPPDGFEGGGATKMDSGAAKR